MTKNIQYDNNKLLKITPFVALVISIASAGLALYLKPVTLKVDVNSQDIKALDEKKSSTKQFLLSIKSEMMSDLILFIMR